MVLLLLLEEAEDRGGEVEEVEEAEEVEEVVVVEEVDVDVG